METPSTEVTTNTTDERPRGWRRPAGAFAALLALGAGTLAATSLPVEASPSESQRLRGLEGRTFAVHTEVIDVPNIPPVFDNCYTFGADGTFINPLFPDFDTTEVVPGTLSQQSTGARTTFVAEVPLGPVLLRTEGTVTPAQGGGVLQITAVSEVFVAGSSIGTTVEAGAESTDCVPSVPVPE